MPIPVGSTRLYVEVGGNGSYCTTAFGGGGTGPCANAAAGGGGASDVRTCSLTNSACPSLGSAQDPRLLVAGGGGGGGGLGTNGGLTTGGNGGDAGAAGTQGVDAASDAQAGQGGQPGTTATGGAGGAGGAGTLPAGGPGAPGTAGTGGTAGGGSAQGGSAGGGYYGGGGGGAGGRNDHGVAGSGGGGGGGGRFAVAGATNTSIGLDTTGTPVVRVTYTITPPSVTLTLATGWNLVDFPLVPATPLRAQAVLASVLQASHGTFAELATWTGTGWTVALPDQASQDFPISALQGYFLYSDAPATYVLSGQSAAQQSGLAAQAPRAHLAGISSMPPLLRAARPRSGGHTR